METNEVIVDNEEYTDFIQDNSENISSAEIHIVENVDLNSAGFIGFGLASAMCIISIAIGSILKMFRAAH